MCCEGGCCQHTNRREPENAAVSPSGLPKIEVVEGGDKEDKAVVADCSPWLVGAL